MEPEFVLTGGLLQPAWPLDKEGWVSLGCWTGTFEMIPVPKQPVPQKWKSTIIFSKTFI